MNSEIKYSILSGLIFGLFFGTSFAILFGINSAFIPGIIFGLIFGAVSYFFIASRIIKKQTQIDNLDEKTIIHSSGASHFINGESFGGRLYLLRDRLQFQSHRFNLKNQGTLIYIEQIEEVNFYNPLGVIPNGLLIRTTDGYTKKFVVIGRRLWKKKIEKLIAVIK